MCGITGILHFGRDSQAPGRVRRMADSVVHRGPDSDGYWSDDDVALGFRRLAIVDIADGEQPMANEDKSVWIVFNGEIYNHRELRRELELAGHQFKSDHSDTEVLVHGWEEWGERLPERLNGMFAFAIWDLRAKSLFLARDRYGIKPLYLATARDGSLVFASEVRALHASGLVPVEADAAGVIEYFSLMNFWHGRTPFRGVSMLQAGHCELVTSSGRRQRKYWDFTFSRNRGSEMGRATDEFREVLHQSVNRQLAADVPVMSYLSGGIDSSSITAVAHQLRPGVRAYSCIFNLDQVGEDRFVDEREFSRAVAQSLGIDRVELEIPQDALIQNLDATIAALEYPRMGMAYVNYLIAKRVSADAKVVLSGMGGDEVTGGYVGRYAIIPRMHGSESVSLADGASADAIFQTFRAMLNVPIRAEELTEAFTPDFLRMAGGFDPVYEIRRAFRSAPSDDPWDALMYVDAKTYLHGLLVLEDKLSMIHSLETRVPLLDNEVVDYALEVPWHLLSDGQTGKILFREAVRPWVPDAIYTKPKMGFGPPDASWYRGRLRPWVEAQLSRLTSQGVFQPSFIRRKLDEHFSGAANHVALIWCLLSFESWCRQSGVLGGLSTDQRQIAYN
ncbi:asparagine synthase (glutamine-hydrolyzing) [Microvirga terricola]|uniref:asparagine synthase (glutamine-hydrolyzing) n=1 Tax=Microvirga terricola TaxID=2719797 RepID=A0ABX0VAE5_9HYPH|nr:asparagine synthase (glutamine-hydrolyzing) [Microvirga terricola]NIX76824.1 asparagine synthase (glutamine-hydrolyzing) [Microvirga terricola]